MACLSWKKGLLTTEKGDLLILIVEPAKEKEKSSYLNVVLFCSFGMFVFVCFLDEIPFIFVVLEIGPLSIDTSFVGGLRRTIS